MVDLTQTQAASIVNKMRVLYGRKFDQQWADVAANDMAQALIDVLSGLSVDEIKNGLRRMNTEQWPPTLPEFRAWCEQSTEWLTADEAWASALLHLADNRSSITNAAYDALQDVRYIVSHEGQKAASRAFKDVYSRIVGELRAAGARQTIYTPVLIAPVPEKEMTPDEIARGKAKAAECIKAMKKKMGVV